MNLEQAIDYRDNYEIKVREAAEFLRPYGKPEFGLVLGSGLDSIADELKSPEVISYEDIPNFPHSTVPGHVGNLFIGELKNVPVMIMQGRKHYYEVADEPMNTGMLQVIFPVHIMAELGIPNYFVTNAAGGLNPEYQPGDLMILRSHINTLPDPLLGRQHDFKAIDGKPLERFQVMNNAYDHDFRILMMQSGDVHEGMYMAASLPCFETEAESVACRDMWKVDAIGASTTPEVMVARNRGMKVVGISCITNIISGDGTNDTSHEEVMSVFESVENKDRLLSVINNFLRLYKSKPEKS